MSSESDLNPTDMAQEAPAPSSEGQDDKPFSDLLQNEEFNSFIDDIVTRKVQATKDRRIAKIENRLKETESLVGELSPEQREAFIENALAEDQRSNVKDVVNELATPVPGQADELFAKAGITDDSVKNGILQKAGNDPFKLAMAVMEYEAPVAPDASAPSGQQIVPTPDDMAILRKQYKAEIASVSGTIAKANVRQKYRSKGLDI